MIVKSFGHAIRVGTLESWANLGGASPTPTPQNKKYLCAIGNSLAGWQTSNSPSALTS
jgi:hypothetical protein